MQIGDDVVGVRIAVRDLKKQNESQIYNWNIKRDASLGGEGDGSKNRKSHGASSNASNYNILKSMTNVKGEQEQKGVTSQSGVAPFVSKDGGIKAVPNITEKDGIRTIGVEKYIDENAFVEGLWEGAENTTRNNVEKIVKSCK